MDSSYQSFSAPCMTKPQQQQLFFQMPPQPWLLQQPHDSGYHGGDDDLFAQAFKTYEPDMNMMNEWAARLSTPSLSISSSSASSPFEYADSLVKPTENWLPYETDLSSYCAEYSAYGLPVNQMDVAALSISTPGNAQMASHCTPKNNDMSQALARQPSSDSGSVQEPETYRPRQREHHTAVEQRYRKNLNQQFVSLRSAVPNIQTSQPQRAGQPAKPSKCEVLAGAVDYIKQLEEENRRLRAVAEDGQDASRKRARTMA